MIRVEGLDEIKELVDEVQATISEAYTHGIYENAMDIAGFKIGHALGKVEQLSDRVKEFEEKHNSTFGFDALGSVGVTAGGSDDIVFRRGNEDLVFRSGKGHMVMQKDDSHECQE